MARKKNQGGEADSLAAELRQAAAQSGLSAYRIAKDAGVDQSTLNKFLNGQRDNLRLDVIERLFKVLGLKVVCKKKKQSG